MKINQQTISKKHFSKKFDFVEFLEKNCTFKIYGNYPFEQEITYCHICDPNETDPICKECWSICHKVCNTMINQNEKKFILEKKNEIKRKVKFVCTCGKKKHDLKVQNEGNTKNNVKEPCFYWEFDKIVRNNYNYSCTSCKKSKICFLCFKKCHFNCKRKGKILNNTKYAYGQNTEALNNFHVSKLNNDSIDVNLFMNDGDFYKNENLYNSDEDDQGDSIYKKEFSCDCDHSNHNSLFLINSMLKNIIPRDYCLESIPFIWPNQIINSLMSSIGVIDNIYSEIRSYFEKYRPESQINIYVNNVFIILTSSIFKVSSLYYFHPIAENLLEYNKGVMFLDTLEQVKLEENSNLITSVMTYILNVHLKQDFQIVKLLSTEDFLVTNPFQRINLKMSILLDSIVYQNIHKKYIYTSNSSSGSLSSLVFIVLNILHKSIDLFEDIIQFFKVYAIGIKIIFFILKIMLFDVHELVKFILLFESFALKVHTGITLVLKRYINDTLNKQEESIEILYSQVLYMTKIYFILSINYNDLVFFYRFYYKNIVKSNKKYENLFTSNTYLHQYISSSSSTITENEYEYDYIHIKSHHSLVLFKIFCSTSLFLSNFIYERLSMNINSYKTLIKLQVHFVSLFFLTDNFYFSKLTYFIYDDNVSSLIKSLSFFENLLVLKLNSLSAYSINFQQGQGQGQQSRIKYLNDKKKKQKNVESSYYTSIGDDDIDVKECYMILNDMENNEKRLDLYMKKEIFNLSERIDKHVKLFFYMKMSFKRMMMNIIKEINNFDLDFVINHSQVEEKEILFNSKKVLDFRIKYHILDILSKINYKFTKDMNFLYNLNEFTREIIIGNIDNTLSRILIINHKNKNYHPLLIQKIFQFFYLFFLSHEGTLHFISGRNIRRILKIFEKFPHLCIVFFLNLSNSIRLFNIDISQHKRLNEILDVIINYISIFKTKSEKEINDFILIYTYTVKIYMNFKIYMDDYSRKQVKTCLLKSLLEKEGLFSNMDFEKIFNEQEKIINEDREKRLNKKNEINLEFNLNDSLFETSKENNKIVDEVYNFTINDNLYDLGFLREKFETYIQKQRKEDKEKEENIRINNKIPKNSIFLMIISKIILSSSTYEDNNDNLKINFIPDDDKTEKNEKNITNEKENVDLDLSNRKLKPDKKQSNEYTKEIIKIKNLIEYNTYLEKNMIVIDEEKFKKEERYLFFLSYKQKLFLSILDLLCRDNYYHNINNNHIEKLIYIVNINHIDLILSKNILNLNDRIIILNSLRCLYLNDIVNSLSNIKINKFPSLKLYSKVKTEKKQKREYKKNEFLVVLYDNFKKTINIICNELKNIETILYLHQENPYDLILYIKNIILIVKLVSDVIILENVPNSISIYFYELVGEFIKKSFFLKEVYVNLYNKGNINDVEIFLNKENLLDEYEKKDFDIFDLQLIYNYFNKYFNIFQMETNMFEESLFSRNLKEFEVNKNMNFNTGAMFFNNFSQFKKENREKQPDCLCGNRNTFLYQKNINDNIYNLNKISKELLFLKQILEKLPETYKNTSNLTLYECLITSKNDLLINYELNFFYYIKSYILNISSSVNSIEYIIFITILSKIIFNTYENMPIGYLLDKKNKILNILSLNFIKSTYSLLYMIKQSLFSNEIFMKKIKFFEIHSFLLEMILKYGNESIKDYIISFDFNEIQLNNEVNKKYKNVESLINKKISNEDMKIKNNKENILELKPLIKLERNNNKNKQVQFMDKDKEEYNDSNNKENIGNEELFVINNTQLYYLYKEIKENLIEHENENDEFTLLQKYINLFLSIIQMFNIYETLVSESIIDKLIIPLISIKNLLREYMQHTSKQEYLLIIHKHFLASYKKIKKIILNHSLTKENFNINGISLYDENRLYRDKVNLLLKLILMEVIVSLIEKGLSEKFLVELISYFRPVELYEEMENIFNTKIIDIYYLNHLVNFKTLHDKEDINYLIELFKSNKIFSSSLELKTCIKYYEFLIIIKETYKNSSIISYFFQIDKEKLKNESFLSKHLIHQFLSRIFVKIEIEFPETQSKQFQFFLIPPICLFLSQQTKIEFLNNVNRQSSSSKILSLLNESDYFMYEMFNNFDHQENMKKSIRYILNILSPYLFQLINYFIIIIFQVFLLINYEGDVNELISQDEKYTLHENCVYLSILQLMLLSIFIFLIFVNNFTNYFHKRLMLKSQKKFLFQKENKASNSLSFQEYYNNFLSDISRKDYFSVLTVESIIKNKNLIYLILSFIMTSMYLIFKSSLFLAFQILFLVNLSNILNGILIAIKLRYRQLFTILIFTYLIVYVYTYFAYIYFKKSMFLLNTIDPDIDPNTIQDLNFTQFFYDEKFNITVFQKQSFCENMGDCFLFHLSYGVRSGGGIGDVLPKISYNQESNSFFFGLFLYEISFHIFIVWIMGNIFFGIIVDTFADLRDKDTYIVNDKENVCFICQLDKDTCITNNIDFDSHVNLNHDVWNYVFYISYLHFKSKNEFNKLEIQVWRKLVEMDTSWFPHYEILDNELDN